MKPTIYLAQSGLGKTYFCQHNAGWLDLDPYPILNCGLSDEDAKKCFLSLIDINLYWGYKIIINANSWTLNLLLRSKQYQLILFYACHEMKDEICERIKQRAIERHNPADKWAQQCDKMFDTYIETLDAFSNPYLTKIQINPGEYVSDYLNKIV